jgi:hypothetical protein
MKGQTLRFLLSLIMFPLSLSVYSLVYEYVGTQVRRDEYAAAWASIFTGVFVAFYWIGVWRKVVDWTPWRRLLTLLSATLCLIPLLAKGLCLDILHIDRLVPSPFLVVITPIPIWLFFTLLIWKETPNERARRTQFSSGKALFCPKCNYNMTGLYEARCPECGERFTLDQLLAAQQRNRLTEELAPPGQESSGR